MPKLDFVFFDAGGGHRAAATALKQECECRFPSWNIRLLNLQEVLDHLDIFRIVTGLRLQDIYNLVLRKGWTFGSPQGLRMMQAVIRLYHPIQVRDLQRYWGQEPPDLLVSLIPNFNRALYSALRKSSKNPKMVTILTDMADYPPHFWIEKAQSQDFICGTPKAVEQALSLGHPNSRVHRASGMVLNPRFYQPLDLDIAAERHKLGLRPDLPTALVLFGGYGSNEMARIAERLAASPLNLQMIFICGKNEKLRAELANLKLRFPHYIEGFTAQVPFYMRLADFFIGKPGPGSISEAIHMGLPVIVTRNFLTLPQERYNADWVLENQVGIVESSFTRIVPAVEQLLAPGQLEQFRRRVQQLQNRAVFEIPDILEQILARVD